MVAALVRVHLEALEGESCGSLDQDELRVVGERVIRFYGFDTTLLVERQIRALAERRRRGSAG
jgi:hypothetical protein